MKGELATQLTWVSFVCCLLATVAGSRAGKGQGRAGLEPMWPCPPGAVAICVPAPL